MKSDGPEKPVTFKSASAWESWLEKHHRSSAGVWLRVAKKGSGAPYIDYQELLDAALCYGWIDAQRKSLDQRYFLQRFTPRGAKSIWSKINRQKALDLIETGRMKPAGLAEVERAQADGRWEAAYDSFSKAAPDQQFQRALDASPRAKAFFAALDSRNRYAILFRIQTAKRPETRARRTAEFVRMLENGEKIH